MVDKLDTFHRTKTGYSIFAIIELLAAYGFMSLAITSGNLWWYLATLVFLVGFLQNIAKLFAKVLGKNKRSAT